MEGTRRGWRGCRCRVAPRIPPKAPPQIRTRPFQASGSSDLRFCCPLLSATVALTRLWTTLSSSRISEWQFRKPTPPLATHRLPRVGFPAFWRYYEGATMRALRLPLSFSTASLRSAIDTSWCLARLLTPAAKSVPVCQVVVLPVSSLFWFSRRGDRRISQVPRKPFRTFALLLDPGRTICARLFDALVLLPWT